jgi:hypothetical protein
MNRSFLFLVAALLIPMGTAVAQPKARALSAYEQAVKAYVDAAAAELAALEKEIETETKGKPEDVAARYRPALRQLERTEESFEALAKARQADFDTKKLAYERARGELVKALEQARTK